MESASSVDALESIFARGDADSPSRTARLPITLERLPIACIIHDAQFHFVYWNPAAERIFGYASDEVMGRHPFDTIVPPAAQPLVRGIFDRLAAGDMNAHGRGDNCTKAGGAIVCEWHNTPLLDSAGRFIGLLSLAQDVTARVVAETALLASEARFRDMFEKNRAVQYVVDPTTGAIVDANPAAAEFYGYPLEVFRQTNIRDIDLLPPERIEADLRRARAEERDYFVVPHRLASGEIRAVEVRSSPVVVAGKTLLFSIVHDITDRHQAEVALRRSEERHRMLLDCVPDIVYAIDRNHRLTSVSRACEAILGWRPEELVGRAVNDIIHPDERQLPADRLRRVFGGARVPPQQYRMRTKSGEYKVLELLPVGRVEDGAVVDVIGIARDVTEMKLAQEHQRALELKLQQAQKLESLGVLAGGVAHDFNNLLTPLIGYADLLVQQLPADSPLRPLAEQIERAGQRAAELTRQMLAYSGGGKFVVEQVDLSALVREMYGLLQSVVSRRATVRLHLADDLPPVEADVTELRQVVMNLITNAAEAIVGRAGTIDIATGVATLSSEDLSRTMFPDVAVAGRFSFAEVADTGCGMDETTRARMFDPFFTTKFTGRGLGLASVLGIVRGHQGTLVVESSVGVGTRFRVYFPVSVLPTKRPPIERKPAKWWGRGVVLVVDDEPDVRLLAQRLLENWGFGVVACSDGATALDQFGATGEQFVLTLLDLTMPRLGGREVQAEIRRRAPQARVLLMSGFGESAAPESDQRDHYTGFLAKPFRMENMLAAIRRLVASAPTTSGPAWSPPKQ